MTVHREHRATFTIHSADSHTLSGSVAVYAEMDDQGDWRWLTIATRDTGYRAEQYHSTAARAMLHAMDHCGYYIHPEDLQS